MYILESVDWIKFHI